MPNEFGDSAVNEFGDRPVSAATPPPNSQHPSMGHVGDFMAGVGAGGIGTVLGAYELLRKIPGADKVLPAVSDEVRSYAEPPDTVSAKVGKFLEGAAEFAVPAGEVGAATKGAGLLGRAAAQAGTAGAVRAAQTGGDVPQSLDAAALGAAGPVVGAGLKAAAPVLRNAPGTAFDVARFVLHPTPSSAIRLGQRLAGAAGKAAEEAAPEAAAAAEKTPGQILAESDGKTWASVPKGERQVYEKIAELKPKFEANKAAEVPPTTPAPSNTPVAQPTASAAAPAAKVTPIRPEPAPTPAPTPTEAPKADVAGNAAKSYFAKAKSQRYADAINKWAADRGISPATAAEGWEAASPETRGIWMSQMKRKGYLGANETIPNTSAPGIVEALKARAAQSQ